MHRYLKFIPLKQRKPFTNKDLIILKKLVEKKTPYPEIAQKMRRTEFSLKMKISRMGLSKIQTRWTDKEIAVLLKKSGDGIDALVKLLPDHSRASIVQKAYKQGVPLDPDKWSQHQDATLKKLFPKTANEVISEKIGKTVSAIRNRAVHFRLKKSDRYWDKWEEDMVLNSALSAEVLAAKLKKSKWAVYAKRRVLTKNIHAMRY